MQKLAGLVKVGTNTLEAALNRLKPAPVRRKAPEKKPATAPAVRSYLSSPLEEYALTLLLQYPEMKTRQEELSGEYFEISENREIFLAWQAADDVSNIKDTLDPALYEHYDKIINRQLPTVNNIDQRFTDSVIELRKKYLKHLAARKAESGKAGEEDIEISNQLREVYSQKNLKRREARR
jgi:deoxyadenosine/deoxycytidine kinase